MSFEKLEALEKKIAVVVREAIKSLNELVQGSIGEKNAGITRAERLRRLDDVIPRMEKVGDNLARHLQAIQDAVERVSEGRRRLRLVSQIGNPVI